ncbi:hypothetical protein EB796_009883 [Bugula neritina]|uniref:UPAR/Ly6 domain-containing protein qvr n=1 Tax=Bugula neritina TaxID=10212 RepID=A0A7J7K0V0_BUGNE|nr:hypothetical protein EB796_009883 [Bugula neritina]
MWPSVNSSLLGMLCFVSLLVPVYTAADDTECILPKYINCFNCDSRIHSFCEDKFNKTASISLDHMKRCEGECLKWVRNIDPANPDLGSYIIRTCKTDVSIDMYLSPDMCLDESRPGSGHMCTCPEERCNSAMPSLSTSHITLLIPTLCWIVKFFK